MTPALVRSIKDVVLGVQNSKFLRWLIQNRRAKGEQGSREGGGPDDDPERPSTLNRSRTDAERSLE